MGTCAPESAAGTALLLAFALAQARADDVDVASRRALQEGVLGANDAARAAKDGAKKTGHAVRDVTRKTGHAFRGAARQTGHAARDAARQTGHAFRDAAKRTTK